ncbi:MAG: cytochrome c maturation protein CcmE [Rickettsiaceae bacterium]|nr:cytochrome c maturation protein CcmE [Rickettsiaceae bacterium]
MHAKTRKRLYEWLFIFISCAVGVAIILYFLSDTIAYYVTPSKLLEESFLPKQQLKLGGYVQTGSLNKISIEESEFVITDRSKSIKVKYTGPLPMIFREEQGVVVIGTFDREKQIFTATSLLAKHDEKYKPKNIKPF